MDKSIGDWNVPAGGFLLVSFRFGGSNAAARVGASECFVGRSEP
jgi:hypothetical protein